MSRIGYAYGKKMLFTHHDHIKNRYWTDDWGGGCWFNSNEIRFAGEPKKKPRFFRKER